MRGAFLRFRVMAWVTGAFLAAMTIWFVVGYGFLGYEFGVPESKPPLFSNLWTIHGVLYVLYLVVGVDLAFRVRYSVIKTLGILIAGTVPFASFFAEAAVHKDLAKRELLVP